VSTETGKIKSNLHIQGLMALHYGTTKEHLKELAKILKALLPPLERKQYKLQIKVLARAQTFLAMIGYITKDYQKAHYRILVHNISAQVR
jgi:hypothetical protein